MKQIITSHFVNDKNKEGVPFKTKKGEPFSKVTIKVAADPKDPKEWDDQYISGLSFNPTDACRQWAIGDEVDIIIEKNGEFWNFKTPSRLDRLEARIEVLEAFMGNGGEKPILTDGAGSEGGSGGGKVDLPELAEEDEIPF